MLRHRLALFTAASLAVALPACGDDSESPAGAGGSGGTGGTGEAGAPPGGGGAGGAGGAPVCGSASGALREGLDTLAWDDGESAGILRDLDTAVDVDGHHYVLDEEWLYEGVRFDLERPALVYGFSIRWGGLPEDAPAELELEAGLYEDFGYNGFDFWAPDPLFQGTRCAGDIGEDGYVTYVLDEPVAVEHPGLVYVAHLTKPGEPQFQFDGSVTGAGDCALFADCHSNINMPEVLQSSYYNGVSFQFPNDYMVRLHVEYTDDVAPAERLFQPLDLAGFSHASFGDYDNDGDDDLVTEGPRLFQNQGDGTFVEVTTETGIAAMGIAGTGGVFGDYDNDGCLDLFVYAESYTAPDALLRSACNGTFTDVTAAAGIVDQQSYEDCNGPGVNVRSPTAGAAWLDVDGDGFLDLFLANFICWDKGTGYRDTLWRSRGDGTFEDWSGTHGFASDRRSSRGANPIDADQDGDIDLFVNTYRLQKDYFFVNGGGGSVTDDADAAGVGGTLTQGYYGHTIGSAWGDLDGDGDFDLIAANLAHPRFFGFSDKTEVFIQQPNGTFVDRQGDWQKPHGAAGLRYQETHSVPALADFDQDGALDLVITAVYDGRPTDFYWGQGDGTFVLDAYHAGITTKNGWGVALADIDLDGDEDVFATQAFRNDIPNQGHYLQVRAVGNVTANRAAIGAVVTVETPTRSILRYVQGGTGQGNQDSMYLAFGLGDETTVDAIRVAYPGGATVVYDGPFEVDRRYWVYEDGAVLEGLTNPT